MNRLLEVVLDPLPRNQTWDTEILAPVANGYGGAHAATLWGNHLRGGGMAELLVLATKFGRIMPLTLYHSRYCDRKTSTPEAPESFGLPEHTVRPRH